MSHEELTEAFRGWEQGSPPRYNLAVLGGTGVGKSTLVNAVFGEDVAATGIGRPVTKGVNFHVNAQGTLGLYDFEGLEAFADLDAFIADFERVYKERLEADPAAAIHGVWYCVNTNDRRFDEHQEAAVRRLSDLKLPIILVMTQTQWRPHQGFAPDARLLMEHITGLGLPIVGGRPIPVSAQADAFAGTHPHGLEHLLKVTFDAAPVGVRTAFASAQRIDADMKRVQARKVVAKTVALASGIGAVPIPVPDAPALVAVQFRMLRQVSGLYGVKVAPTALAGALAGTGATMAGRSIVGALLKVVPVAGSAINASTAGALTSVLGWAWLELCERDWKGELDLADLGRRGKLAPVLLEALRIWSKRRPGKV